MQGLAMETGRRKRSRGTTRVSTTPLSLDTYLVNVLARRISSPRTTGCQSHQAESLSFRNPFASAWGTVTRRGQFYVDVHLSD